MVVAGGFAGFGAQAAAAEVYTLDLAGPTDGTEFSYDITMPGSAVANFRYQGGEGIIGVNPGPFAPEFVYGVKHTFDALGTSLLNTTRLSSFSLPTSTVGMSGGVSATTYKEEAIVPTAVDSYYHLAFDADGTQYLGTAKFAGTTLESITYTAGVPEPDAWALMILGVGATGAVLRRRRQAQLAAA